MSDKFESWEPNPEDNSPILSRCIKRIERDISDIVKKPPPGIFALPNEDNMRLMKILIIGPKDTPYEGGMLTFMCAFTDSYPTKPPKFKALTTAGGTVRFNPNIYACGKLCLSILGTWNGPAWAPVMNLTSVAVSIQTLLNEEPYRNEPGRSLEDKTKIDDYNLFIEHETIRIAVIDVMENIGSYDEYFAEKIEATFEEHYDHYVDVCNKNLHRDGETLKEPLDNKSHKLQYKVMLEKLENLKMKRSQCESSASS